MLLKPTTGSPIDFTQGDVVTLQLTATDDQGNPVDLTGAAFETLIQGSNGVGPVVFPDGLHTANPDQVNNTGQFALALAAVDTQACGEGAHKEILTQVTIGAITTYYRGDDLLTVYPPIPRQ